MADRKSAIEEAEEAGFDLSLVDCSLSYSFEKRAKQHQAALTLALELEKIGRQLRDRLKSTPPAAVRRKN